MPARKSYPSWHLVPSPFWDLLMLQFLRPDSSNFPCLYSTFHLECPFLLSWFCLSSVFSIGFKFNDHNLKFFWRLCVVRYILNTRFLSKQCRHLSVSPHQKFIKRIHLFNFDSKYRHHTLSSHSLKIIHSPASMSTVSESVICTTYHIWRQHLCCDYNKWFPSHHGDSQRVSPLYHLPHMTPGALLWLKLLINPQPLWRQSASESSVPLTIYDTSISVVTTISHSPAIMAKVSEWVLCTTYHIWRQHLCCDYNKYFPSHHGDSRRVSPLYHLPYMTPASLLWLQSVILQPSWRK